VAERGQLAKVFLRRTEGQALCLQLAAKRIMVHIIKRRQIMGPLLLKLFWHVDLEGVDDLDDPATGCHCSTLSAKQALSSFQLLMYISIPTTFI